MSGRAGRRAKRQGRTSTLANTARRGYCGTCEGGFTYHPRDVETEVIANALGPGSWTRRVVRCLCGALAQVTP